VSGDSPRDLSALYENKTFVHRAPVKVGMVRVMRTRPVFPRWRLRAVGMVDDAVLNLADLRHAAQAAGQLIGLGDGRPMFGRFTCTVEGQG
jgi:hypothetical protein